MDREILFVYGTLKRGQPLHYLLEKAVFLGEGWVKGFLLFDLGDYPAVRPGNSSRKVYGELYAIPPDLLKILDQVEDEYYRQKIPVFTSQGVVKAWIYIYKENLPLKLLLPKGRWEK